MAVCCTLNLNKEVSSAALQSNGNDCTPGMSEECICVLPLERSNEDGRTHTKVAIETERTEDSYYNTEFNLNFKDCDKNRLF